MKDLKYYLELPYTVVVRRDEDGDFVARVDELPGCAAHGKSAEEALANLEEAEQLWIAESLDAGRTVPEPAGSDIDFAQLVKLYSSDKETIEE